MQQLRFNARKQVVKIAQWTTTVENHNYCNIVNKGVKGRSFNEANTLTSQTDAYCLGNYCMCCIAYDKWRVFEEFLCDDVINRCLWCPVATVLVRDAIHVALHDGPVWVVLLCTSRHVCC
jgi:hypothetical protein